MTEGSDFMTNSVKPDLTALSGAARAVFSLFAWP